MKAFARLYSELDASTSTSAKVAALSSYFSAASPSDAAWAVYFLAGGRPRQMVPTKLLRAAALQFSGLSEWLFEESYQAVGDLAETIAHVLPPPSEEINLGLAQWLEGHLLPLRGTPPEVTLQKLGLFWDGLDISQRFLLNKLLTGGFRVGVSKLLVVRALSETCGVDKKLLTQRLMGYTDPTYLPTAAQYLQLIDSSADASNAQQSSQPYPFFLAHQWAEEQFAEGAMTDWQIEWKWDGIRAQLVKRDGQYWVWSRGEELLTDRFPELAAMAEALPDGTVLDGEILAWDHSANLPLGFALLQQRITRKLVTTEWITDIPVVFRAYDLLEHNAADIRELPLQERRTRLEMLLVHPLTEFKTLDLSETVVADSWASLFTARQESRNRGVEGFMLKHQQSRYGVGRTKADGIWWKWKVDPFSIDCVLIYAQRGHGRRASLYTDYTFAVWDDTQPTKVLVPFAKAYSGLTDAEFKRVDEVIRKTTIDKFGPVRSVTPTLVFELAFEGIQESKRHKAGIAVRFPRILRWREDKTIEQADTLASLAGLLAAGLTPPEKTSL